MEHLTYKDNKNLIDYICDNFLSLSKGKYESFVVENLIKANNDNEIKLKIEQAILDNISEMIKNIYSVYVFRTYSKQLNNSAKPINHLFETGFEINSSMPSRTLVRV
ncbi:hypothetical protein MHBO_005088 [Bonamia ostreae]|uniref:Uncharacterized protein n=1 Tax=Bonamia ostreae TaxID=126728 RepID=A0ABV2AV25_9EUKA